MLSGTQENLGSGLWKWTAKEGLTKKGNKEVADTTSFFLSLTKRVNKMFQNEALLVKLYPNLLKYLNRFQIKISPREIWEIIHIIESENEAIEKEARKQQEFFDREQKKIERNRIARYFE